MHLFPFINIPVKFLLHNTQISLRCSRLSFNLCFTGVEADAFVTSTNVVLDNENVMENYKGHHLLIYNISVLFLEVGQEKPELTHYSACQTWLYARCEYILRLIYSSAFGIL